MLYSFGTDELREISAANYCFFDRPTEHPTRTMPCHDFVYMVDGEWRVGAGNEKFTVKTNEVLILPANVHHYGIKPCSPKTKTMYFHIASTLDDAPFSAAQCRGGIVLDNLIGTVKNPNIKSLFEKIIKTKSNERIAGAYFNCLLYELSELSEKKGVISLANAIHTYVLSSGKIPGNKEIAEHFNVSVKTAETVFKNEYCTTIHRFVIDSKLKESQNYLLDYPDMTISSIAITLGFYDEFHFSKTFKSAYGMSPSEFRRKGVLRSTL
ncbi:MAG: helix-turn-helix domain-containing protein [Clostridia bacterium]|nr:helix-turn-helix domain-containing protein [Clostridia bacterium]